MTAFNKWKGQLLDKIKVRGEKKKQTGGGNSAESRESTGESTNHKR